VANDEIPPLGELDWSPNARTESLSKVFAQAVAVSKNAENWYDGKYRSKRQWGRRLRMTAIVLGIVGGVLPIVTEITSSSGKPTIAPGWTAVALVLAAGCGILDRYLGFSSAWMRFIVAMQRLERQRRDFEYAWNEARIKVSRPTRSRV
jgi:SMODS and SLOG-associating 2TM effector domain 2